MRWQLVDGTAGARIARSDMAVVAGSAARPRICNAACNSPCPATKSATAHAGLIVSHSNSDAATTESTNNGSSTEGLGVAPSPATWLATALVKRTDGSVSARTQRSAVSPVIANTPGTPANLTARNTTNASCTDPETRLRDYQAGSRVRLSAPGTHRCRFGTNGPLSDLGQWSSSEQITGALR